MDGPVDEPGELEQNLAEIEFANRWLGGIAPILREVRRCGARTILDVGSGSGDVPHALVADGRRRGIEVRGDVPGSQRRDAFDRATPHRRRRTFDVRARRRRAAAVRRRHLRRRDVHAGAASFRTAGGARTVARTAARRAPHADRRRPARARASRSRRRGCTRASPRATASRGTTRRSRCAAPTNPAKPWRWHAKRAGGPRACAANPSSA